MAILPTQAMTLIADDIREEKSGKQILIGIYGDSIFVENVPGIIPKLCFFTRVTGGDGEVGIKVSLKDPSGTELLKDGHEGRFNQRTGMVGNIVIGVTPMQLTMEGVYTYSIMLDGKVVSTCPFHVRRNTELM